MRHAPLLAVVILIAALSAARCALNEDLQFSLDTITALSQLSVNAAGASFARSSAVQELRPLISTPSELVCSKDGIFARAAAIATESVAFSAIQDIQPAFFIPSLQCFGRGAPYAGTDSLWRDVLLCSSHTPSSSCASPQPSLSSLFLYPAIHRFASAQDFTQQLLRNAQDLAILDLRLSENSNGASLLQQGISEAIYGDFASSRDNFIGLVDALASLLPLQPNATDVAALQDLFTLTNDSLLPTSQRAALFVALAAQVSSLQSLGAALSASLSDISSVPALPSLSAIATDSIARAAAYAAAARNATLSMSWSQDSVKFSAIQGLVLSVLQISSSALQLSFRANSALLAASLTMLNSPACGLLTSTAPTPSCALFSYATLADEMQRVRYSVYQLYSALMLWAETMSVTYGEPFACWRSALVRLSTPLLSFFQDLPSPAGFPFDASLCETAWLRSQSIAFEASVYGEMSCAAGNDDLLTCSASRNSLYASSSFASVALVANYALAGSNAQLLLNGTQQTLSGAFASSYSLCPPACAAGEFCSTSARCVAAPLGYWSIGNGSNLIACNPISATETSPLVGYTAVGMSSAACATGIAYQAVGSVDAASLSALLPAEGFTVEMWLRVSVPSSFGLVDLTHYWAWELLFNSTLNTSQFRFTIAPSGAQYDSATFTLPMNQFVHFACSVISGQLAFAIDGGAISYHLWDAPVWPAAGPLPNSSLFVGGAGNALEPLLGLVNEIRIYSSHNNFSRSGAQLSSVHVAAHCDPFAGTLCNNSCVPKCSAGQVLDDVTCMCRCPPNTELCGGVCVPLCPPSFVRDELCHCDCTRGEVALWQLNWLTIASPILANDPGNYYSGNTALVLGLTEIELFNQDGEQVFPIDCIDSGAEVGHYCSQLYDGMKSNAEADMWLAGAGQGYAWLSLNFGKLVNVSRVMLYNWNSANASPNLGMARVKLYAGQPGAPFAIPLYRAAYTSLALLDGTTTPLTEANAFIWKDRDDAALAGPLVCAPCATDASAPTCQSPRSSVTRDCICSQGYTRFGIGERCVPALKPPSFSPMSPALNTEALVSLSSDFAFASLFYTAVDNTTGTVLIPWTAYSGLPVRLACLDDVSECNFTITARSQYRTVAVSADATHDVTVRTSLVGLAPSISGESNYAEGSIRITINKGVTDPRVVCRFTADGTPVTPTSMPYIAPFLIAGNAYIRAKNYYTAGTIRSESAETSGIFPLLPLAAAPTIDPPSGTYGSITITLSAPPSPSLLIYFTTDGSDPANTINAYECGVETNSFIILSLVYNGSISLAALPPRPLCVTLKAINSPPGMDPSSVVIGNYTILPRAAAPVLQPPSGNFRYRVSGEVSCPTVGSAPYVEVNGSADPTLQSEVLLSPFTYLLPIDREDAPLSIAVRCIRNGFLPSETVRREYFLTNYSLPDDPIPTPLPDEYHVDGNLTFSFTCREPQCQIYWSSSLLRPNKTTGQLYSEPLSLPPGSHAISAVAFAPNMDRPSRSISQFVYLVIGVALPPPIFNPPSTLFFMSATNVSIVSPAPGTIFQFALLPAGDGDVNASTIAWKSYTGPFLVTASMRVVVLQDNRYYFADNVVYQATYILAPLSRHSASLRMPWWGGFLLGVGLVALGVLVITYLYMRHIRQQEEKGRLVKDVLPALGLVIPVIGNTDSSSEQSDV